MVKDNLKVGALVRIKQPPSNKSKGMYLEVSWVGFPQHKEDIEKLVLKNNTMFRQDWEGKVFKPTDTLLFLGKMPRQMKNTEDGLLKSIMWYYFFLYEKRIYYRCIRGDREEQEIQTIEVVTGT